MSNTQMIYGLRDNTVKPIVLYPQCTLGATLPNSVWEQKNNITLRYSIYYNISFRHPRLTEPQVNTYVMMISGGLVFSKTQAVHARKHHTGCHITNRID